MKAEYRAWYGRAVGPRAPIWLTLPRGAVARGTKLAVADSSCPSRLGRGRRKPNRAKVMAPCCCEPAWLAREALAPLGVTYVPTPPTAVDGKLYSAAGAAGGIEACLLVMEQLTGSRGLSQTMEFAAEWNPRMLYDSGDPRYVSPGVIESFMRLISTDPMFRSALP